MSVNLPFYEGDKRANSGANLGVDEQKSGKKLYLAGGLIPLLQILILALLWQFSSANIPALPTGTAWFLATANYIVATWLGVISAQSEFVVCMTIAALGALVRAAILLVAVGVVAFFWPGWTTPFVLTLLACYTADLALEIGILYKRGQRY